MKNRIILAVVLLVVVGVGLFLHFYDTQYGEVMGIDLAVMQGSIELAYIGDVITFNLSEENPTIYLKYNGQGLLLKPIGLVVSRFNRWGVEVPPLDIFVNGEVWFAITKEGDPEQNVIMVIEERGVYTYTCFIEHPDNTNLKMTEKNILFSVTVVYQ